MCREAVDAQPSTSRPAGERKQTAELSAAQIARNTELINRLRGKLVSPMSSPRLCSRACACHAGLQAELNGDFGTFTSCTAAVCRHFTWMLHTASQMLHRLAQILAPLTRGGNVPFRRLCTDFGAEVTMSEMSFARFLLKGDPLEKTRLRKADNEHCFGKP